MILVFFSADDMRIFVSYPAIETKEIATNGGKIWYIHKKDNYDHVKVLDLWKKHRAIMLEKKQDDIVEIFLESAYNYVERSK